MSDDSWNQHSTQRVESENIVQVCVMCPHACTLTYIHTHTRIHTHENAFKYIDLSSLCSHSVPWLGEGLSMLLPHLPILCYPCYPFSSHSSLCHLARHKCSVKHIHTGACIHACTHTYTVHTCMHTQTHACTHTLTYTLTLTHT